MRRAGLGMGRARMPYGRPWPLGRGYWCVGLRVRRGLAGGGHGGRSPARCFCFWLLLEGHFCSLVVCCSVLREWDIMGPRCLQNVSTHTEARHPHPGNPCTLLPPQSRHEPRHGVLPVYQRIDFTQHTQQDLLTPPSTKAERPAADRQADGALLLRLSDCGSSRCVDCASNPGARFYRVIHARRHMTMVVVIPFLPPR